jgi:putative tryptophan/tyrosine transport system substrate-binding protein
MRMPRRRTSDAALSAVTGIRRRELIALFGAAALWPLAARAGEPMPVVGFLSNRAAAESEAVVAAFRQGLADAGFIEGRNLAIKYRLAEGHLDRLPSLAADLVGRRVAVIAATGGIAAARAAKAATSTIPIVFTNGTDPIKFGLVADLKRPGGNITGVSLLAAAPAAKRLALMRDLCPGGALFAVLADPTNAGAAAKADDLRTAAAALDQAIVILPATSAAEIEAAFAALAGRGVAGLLVSNEVLFTSRRDQVVALAARHGVPTIYAYEEFVAAGGLMSYGPSRTEGYRQSGGCVARILKGGKRAICRSGSRASLSSPSISKPQRRLA